MHSLILFQSKDIQDWPVHFFGRINRETSNFLTLKFSFQVRAIVVHDEAVVEVGVDELGGEEVFLSQLFRRASLLNSRFHKAVIQVHACV